MPSVPVTSLRVPCIEGLVIVMVTPGITAPLASVILPLMAPVVVLTVWPDAATADASASTTTRTGIWQCSRLMRLLRVPRERATETTNVYPPTGGRFVNGHYT